MGFSTWLSDNWFVLLQSLGIIAGFVFTAHSLRSETKMRRVGNLLAITESHRKLWTEFSNRRELRRRFSILGMVSLNTHLRAAMVRSRPQTRMSNWEIVNPCPPNVSSARTIVRSGRLRAFGCA